MLSPGIRRALQATNIPSLSVSLKTSHQPSRWRSVEKRTCRDENSSSTRWEPSATRALSPSLWEFQPERHQTRWEGAKMDFCCQPLWPCTQYTFNKPLCFGINKKEKRKQPTPYFCRVRRKEPCDFAKGKARFRGLRVILPLMEHWWTSLLDDHFKKGCYISITLFQNSIYRNRIQAWLQ